MPHHATNTIDSDIQAFANTAPPPPYPGTLSADMDYDLEPTPHALNRPRLPEDNRNPFLKDLPDEINVVKFQTIVREGKEIVVGRIKVPVPRQKNAKPNTPDPHAFILRRYDTNAVSLTTMFKVAFPDAKEDDEKREMDWVKSAYDIRDTNGARGNDAVRLAGQWVSRHLAIHLAPAYGLTSLVMALARAVPDPNVAYRKSLRSQAASDEIARQRSGARATVPSLTADTASPAPKRQRRQSPRAPGRPDSSEDSRRLTLEATTTVTAPAGHVNMEAEIETAKQLVQDLKRELRMRTAAGEALEEQGIDIGETSRGMKRGKGEGEGVTISGGATSKERVVRKNKRVVQNNLGDTAKRVAWTALIFGLGVGAASLLPQFASNFF